MIIIFEFIISLMEVEKYVDLFNLKIPGYLKVKKFAKNASHGTKPKKFFSKKKNLSIMN